jgi:general secretion pathway protein G
VSPNRHAVRGARLPPLQAGGSVLSRANRARRTAHDGFTLIELLVVITVIAILAGLVAPMVFSHVGDAKTSAARAQIELFGLALEAYRLDNDYYPSTAQGLESLRTKPVGDPEARNWRGPYLKKTVPFDPWGRPYVYKSPGAVNPQGYDLLTFGRDGQPGGTGEDADITSWESARKP